MEPNSQPPNPPPCVTAEVIDPRQYGPPRRRMGPLGGCLFVLLLLILAVSLVTNLALLAGGPAWDEAGRVEERFFSHNRTATDKIAILGLEGTILEGRGHVKRQIERVLKDENVRAVVLRVNSPGGTVSGSDYLYHHLSRMAARKGIPVVVSMGAIAASGGYYVAMAVGPRPDTIFAEPTTWTGSIGVMIPHYNFADLMQNWGIEQDSIVSHRLKGIGSFTRKMTEEERAILQTLVDESFAGFKNVVKKGRPQFQNDPAALDKIATGQVFTANQALQNGLVDKIGFLEDAVAQAIRLAGLSEDEVRVVEYKPEFSLMELILGQAQARNPARDLDALLELAVPRAYYLCSWLPPAVSNTR